MSDFKGYRVVAVRPLLHGGMHRTPWTRWLTREQATRIATKHAAEQAGYDVRVESRRGALYTV